jgi:hypothetical protein
MSLAEIHKKAKLVMIPSGFKSSSSTDNLYSVIPSNGDGDFNYAGTTNGTRVNKDGLIEIASSNQPRLDYNPSNPQNPHLLLEPERKNLLTKSEQPANWTYTEFGSGSAGTITTGKLDVMGGTNAVQIDFPSDADNVSINFGQSTSSVASGSVAVSVYIKLVESGSKILQFRCSTGVQTNVTVNTTDFVRYEVTGTRNSNESFGVKLRPSVSTSSGGFSIIICQPQEETGTFATSYIPTTGSEATRTIDTCNSAGNSTIINTSEGVLFAEIAALANDSSLRDISINNNDTDRILLSYLSSSNRIAMQFIDGGISQFTLQFDGATITNFNKIAIKYKSSDYALWVNGSERATNTSHTNALAGLDRINFDRGDGGDDFFGKCKQLMYFDTILTDAELTTLTT